MSIRRILLHGALSASTAMAAIATAAVGLALPTQASATEYEGNENAVFARFSDLDAEETLVRLELLQASYGKVLAPMLDQLAKADTTARDIEGQVGPMVAGLTEAEADSTLAAIMLNYYTDNLQEGLQSGELQPSDVFDEMIARDQVLTTAAFGRSTSSRARRNVRR